MRSFCHEACAIYVFNLLLSSSSSLSLLLLLLLLLLFYVIDLGFNAAALDEEYFSTHHLLLVSGVTGSNC